MANRYWVGGTGNWDDSTTTHWSDTSGGTGGFSVPSSADDVYFDLHSNESSDAAYTLTITSQSYCKNLYISFTGTTKVTVSGSSTLLVYGNLNFSGGTTQINWTHTGTIGLYGSSGTQTITTNGIIHSGIYSFTNGSTKQLLDNLTTTGSSGGLNFAVSNGGFDANGKDVILTGTSHSITCGTSPTFYNLIITPTTAYKYNKLTLSGDITVSNQITISNGATITNRVLICSDTIGTQRTITAAAISTSNTDWQDIKGAGAASWNMSSDTGGSGNCGGNLMKSLGDAAFTTAVDQHWTNTNGGSWSTSSNWTSRVPLPQDDVYMNCSFGTSKTVYTDMPRLGKNISFAGATWTTALTLALSSLSNYVFGSFTLITGLTLSGASGIINLFGRGSNSLDLKSIALPSGLNVNNPGGTYTLSGSLTTANNFDLDFDGGTFDANDNNITTKIVGGTGTLYMGNGLWTIHLNNSGATAWFFSGTLYCEGSTIKITDTSNTAVTFAGGSKTFNNLWFARGTSTANNNITGSNTFLNIKDDGSVAHSIIFVHGTTQHVTTFTVSGSAGNEITLNSDTTATHSLVKNGGGTILCYYLNIQHSVATPASTWYTSSSTNNQSVSTAGSGWYFAVPPLVCVVGAFTLTGINNIFNKGKGMLISTCSFTLTRIDNIFTTARRIAPAVADFILTGINANFYKGIPYYLITSVTNFILTGKNAIIRATPRLIVSTGQFILTGINAILKFPGWSYQTRHTNTFTHITKNSSSWSKQTKN